MSTQLANMKAEQQALKTEVDHLETAIPMPEAGQLLLKFMTEGEATDMLINPNTPDNEWINNRDSGQCCSIM